MTGQQGIEGAGGALLAPASGFPHLTAAEILESIEEAFYALDRDWRFLYVNHRASFLWGKSKHELLGKSAFAVFPTFAGSPSHRAHERALRTGEKVRIETQSSVLNVPVEINIFSTPFGLAVYFRDISQRRRIERELRERNDALKLAEESAGIGVWDMDLATGLTRYTAQFFRLMGLEPTTDPVSIEAIRALRHPDDREHVLEGFRQCLTSGKDTYEAEYRIIRPDGQTRWIFGRGRVERDAGGNPVRYSGVDIDITERKLAEQRLNDSEQRFRKVFEAAPNGMLLLDAGARIVLANDAAKTLLGYAGESLSGRPVEDLVPASLQLDHRALRALYMREPEVRAMGKGRDLHAQRYDGSLVPVEIGLNPLRTGEGINIIAAITDITERKRAEEQRELLLCELDHRIKNVFAVIAAMVSLSARTASSASELAVALRQRIDALSRAHSLIRGSGVTEAATVSSVIDAVLAPYPQASSQVDRDGPEVRVEAGAAISLSMILHELTTNALKYGALSMSSGRVSISWLVEPACETHKLVLHWHEAGGPRVREPGSRGFGSTMMAQSARSLGGMISCSFLPAGLKALLTAQLPTSPP